jgi:hypothetical protein
MEPIAPIGNERAGGKLPHVEKSLTDVSEDDDEHKPGLKSRRYD